VQMKTVIGLGEGGKKRREGKEYLIKGDQATGQKRSIRLGGSAVLERGLSKGKTHFLTSLGGGRGTRGKSPTPYPSR